MKGKNLENYIAGIPHLDLLDESDISPAIKLFQNKIHDKGTILLKQGFTCRNLYFIQKGLIYCHTPDEKILWYEIEGQSFTEISSFYAQKPSENIITVAENNTELLSISRENLERLFSISDNWKKWAVKFYQHELTRITSYYEGLRTRDATQRYKDLIEEYPDILKKIPLGHIASYLGISQVSLSRIRSGVQKSAGAFFNKC